MTRGITINPPEILRIKRIVSVTFPQIVECVVQNHILAQFQPNRINGRLLVLLGRNRLSVRVTLRGPAGFGDHDGFAVGDLGDQIGPLLHEIPGRVSLHVAVKEGVTVDGAEIRGMTEVRVGLHGHHGIDGHHGTAVARSLENITRLTDRRRHLSDRCFALVEQLVSDANSVDASPISIDGVDESLAFVLQLVDVKNANKKRNAFAPDRVEDVCDLVAISSIKTDQ